MKYTIDNEKNTIEIHRIDGETIKQIWQELKDYEDWKLLIVAGSSNPFPTQSPTWINPYPNKTEQNPYTVTCTSNGNIIK